MAIINPLSTAFEDLIDEYTTTVAFNRSREYMKPLKDSYAKENPSEWDEALSGAIATLQMGIAMSAVQAFNAYILPAIYKRAQIAFTYIIVGKLGKKLTALKFGGKVMGKATKILTDLSSHRQKNTEIAMGMVNHTDNLQMQKEAMHTNTFNSHDKSMVNANAELSNKSLALYTQKTKTGSWTKSIQDKKIYERATGQKLVKGVSWSNLSDKLNSFSEFAISVEGDIVNDAQVKLDAFTANGSTKVL